MARKPKGNGGSGQSARRIAYDYIKSQIFRVIRADGAIGGITPTGHIHFALYSERRAIPRREVYEVKGKASLQKIDSETVSRDSFVREMDVDVIVNVDTAESLGLWLLDRVKQIRERNAGTIDRN
jgi:hypothetical protein